jgi:hypothetical protein
VLWCAQNREHRVRFQGGDNAVRSPPLPRVLHHTAIVV